MKNGMNLKGRSVMRRWQPGVIEQLLKDGFTLEEAQMIAEARGALLGVSVVENLVVNAGLGLVGAVLVDEESVGLTYHALGTSDIAPLPGDVQLGSEQVRKVFSTRVRSSNVITLSVFYLSSEANIYVKEAGVFGGSTASGTANSGTLFSHYLETEDNSAGLQDLTFDYELTVTEG